MKNSILSDTKRLLGLDEDYTAFDLDILTHINTTFSTLHQLGIGPTEGVAIESVDAKWDVLGLSLSQLSMVKTYVYLKVKYLFDPPTTSFHLEAVKAQIQEHESRLSMAREAVSWTPPVVVEEEPV